MDPFAQMHAQMNAQMRRMQEEMMFGMPMGGGGARDDHYVRPETSRHIKMNSSRPL